jgi:DNA repair protein RadC
VERINTNVTAIPRLRISVVREGRARYSEPLRVSSDVFRFLQGKARAWDREHFLTLVLDGKNRVLGFEIVSVGTLTASLVHPREVFKAAILANAAAIIVAHNHPSGDPTPSAEDRAITQRLKDAGELLGIRLLDHVILGDPGYYSFADSGEL